jgi:hypothetical protein
MPKTNVPSRQAEIVKLLRMSKFLARYADQGRRLDDGAIVELRNANAAYISLQSIDIEDPNTSIADLNDLMEAGRNLSRFKDDSDVKARLKTVRHAGWSEQEFFEIRLESPADPRGDSAAVVPPPARTWTEPGTAKMYTFQTDHQFEVWTGFADSKYPVSLSHLCDTVQRWKEQAAMTDTASSFIKTLRKYWKKQNRSDIADRIKKMRDTVQLLPPNKLKR